MDTAAILTITSMPGKSEKRERERKGTTRERSKDRERERVALRSAFEQTGGLGKRDTARAKNQQSQFERENGFKISGSKEGFFHSSSSSRILGKKGKIPRGKILPGDFAGRPAFVVRTCTGMKNMSWRKWKKKFFWSGSNTGCAATFSLLPWENGSFSFDLAAHPVGGIEFCEKSPEGRSKREPA